MTSRFLALEDALTQLAGVPVHLIRVIGPRTAFVAGKIPSDLPVLAPQRVMLDGEWGLLFYAADGERVDPDEIRKLFTDTYDQK